MKAYIHKSILIATVFLSASLLSQNPVSFEEYFLNKSMRIDFYITGDANQEIITLDKIYEQGIWAGNPEKLFDVYGRGRYLAKVYDVASNTLVFSKGFGTIFGEYQDTEPSQKGISKSFHNTVIIPYPQRPVLFVIEKSDKRNITHPVFEEEIDPGAIGIIKEAANQSDRVYEAIRNGDPHKKVDLAFIAEGYTADNFDKFKKDLDRWTAVMFSVEPYKRLRQKFNVYGVFRPSQENGVDQPEKGIFKNTILNASYNALGTPRYLLSDDNKTLRDIASRVPYDALVILANIERYGGGGIYNSYCIFTSDDTLSGHILLHEFGHSFANLGDEYYSSDVAYTDWFPRGVEPVEPNITRLLVPGQIKWQHMVSEGIEIPTPWDKAVYDSLPKERDRYKAEMDKKISQAADAGSGEDELKKLKEDRANTVRNYSKRLSKFILEHPLRDKVGAFEGAGYSSEGIYRPMINCLMFSNSELRFCKVCEESIGRVIDHYSE
jgi:hypothetical protein